MGMVSQLSLLVFLFFKFFFISVDVEVNGMATLTETLYKDLIQGQDVYSDAFRHSFDISYVAIVGSVLHKHLASAADGVMKRINRYIYKHSAGTVRIKFVVEKKWYFPIRSKTTNHRLWSTPTLQAS